MQPRHRAEDRREDQRHHHHLQQLHIAVAGHVDPVDRGLQRRRAVAIDELQPDPEQRAQDQGDEDPHRQRELSALETDQHHDQRDKDQEVDENGCHRASPAISD
ncbi:hypothetical protein O4J55_10080 [Paracoccus sp. PXZ]